MTTAGTDIEVQVADSARAWQRASRGEDAAAREGAERQLADHLERWLAQLLETDATWPLRGRWFDGLVLHACGAEDDERLNLRGYIWSIDQEQYPFEAMLRLATAGLAEFDVRIGLPRSSEEWAFHFVKSEGSGR